ncbi:histidine phosphatase family protein [Streptomyces sp. TRM 70351]|uniref:histidine phosphatase family protein n=1 Tax=Streptomyces sp. TRM 70351 TaxID=3116552 RepID=UPI002E7BB775|nr:histidine phosphatase family protein [Streptomyces sp. TRM 70351]MEE1926628.1 histidine phosphatase family protein [Streptomyces sp. TRM 70351]
MGRPRRIVLLRHGESEGNNDDSLYERVPDHALRLTPRGRRQAAAAGEELRAVFGEERVSAYVSPYRRTHETFGELRLAPSRVRVREEPRLREQDWGNWQDPDEVRRQKAARNAYGHFFYRFSQGESGADVYDRVGAFLESLWRSFREDDHPQNVLLVTHGLTMRLFCMRWMHWSVAEFESLSNPGNGETRTLLLGSDGRYHLDRPFERWCVPESYEMLWAGGAAGGDGRR